jgi:hypothetical protein
MTPDEQVRLILLRQNKAVLLTRKDGKLIPDVTAIEYGDTVTITRDGAIPRIEENAAD